MNERQAYPLLAFQEAATAGTAAVTAFSTVTIRVKNLLRDQPERHDFARSAAFDGTLVEACAPMKSSKPKAETGGAEQPVDAASAGEDGRAPDEAPPASDTVDKSRNAEVNFHGQKRSNETQASGYRSRRLPAKASQPSSALWAPDMPFQGIRKRIEEASGWSKTVGPASKTMLRGVDAGARRSPSRSLTAISPACASHDGDPTHRCRQIQGRSP